MNQFRKLRINAEITQEELAVDLGITQSAVAKWEKGDTSPRAELLPRIASVLGCTVDELLKKEGSSLEERKEER
ncbi:MAG: helix-turn-helix transcriptional regulator [Clostridia bacterium]|nr:helix-turn-helix transcriptional regulator [Clostridia bacterium]